MNYASLVIYSRNEWLYWQFQDERLAKSQLIVYSADNRNFKYRINYSDGRVEKGGM